VAGVKKLEEIIKAILSNTFATTLTEEMLLKMGFFPVLGTPVSLTYDTTKVITGRVMAITLREQTTSFPKQVRPSKAQN
jgi:hypothetical protein